MKRLLVGGPLLGERSDDKPRKKRAPPSWNTYAPLISSASFLPGNQERWILLPSARHVTVLSYQTGKRIATLLPQRCKADDDADDDDNDATLEITSVALAMHHQPFLSLVPESSSSSSSGAQEVLLVGCNDGTIREFRLADLVPSFATTTVPPHKVRSSSAPYSIPGTCLSPVCIWRVAEQGCAVQQLAAACNGSHGCVLYAVVDKKKKDEKQHALSLLRVTLPSAVDNKGITSLLEEGSHIHMVDETIPNQKGTKPFSLLVSCRPGSGGSTCMFVLLAFTCSILIYYESMNDSGSNVTNGNNDDPTTATRSVEFGFPPSNPLTTVQISSNGNDVACGHLSGAIRVHMNLLTRIQDYVQQKVLYEASTAAQQQNASGASAMMKKPKHFSHGLVIRKLHWHAHAVATMAFAGGSNNDPVLYSGGDESVLCTWQLSWGTDRPVQLLPRVALAGIVHVQTSGQDAILVYCSDNSLHLFETHNQFLRWKVQGLAAGSSNAAFASKPRLLVDPSTAGSAHANLLLTGTLQVPGHIQTYDPRLQQATASLEVAPFNRVSRTAQGDAPMPTPAVTHCSICKHGSTMLTIDTTPTENRSVGATLALADGSLVGSVTTIRFWSLTAGSYQPVAAMASPHGGGNRVAAAVLSADGRFACTVSNDEGAFRLWRRLDTAAAEDSATRSTEWVCRYKVQVPAGYSNYATGESAVSFSGDSSVLAIAFGNIVTLWDHHDVTLLTSLWHLDKDESMIDSVQFLNSSKLTDALLVSSARGVTLQSPYNKQGPSGMGWEWEIPSTATNMKLVFTDFVADCDVVCISLFDETNGKSRIFLVDAVTGGLSSLQGPTASEDIIQGEVIAIAGVANVVKSSRWDKDEIERLEEQHTFYALKRNGELFSLVKRIDEQDEVAREDPLQVSAIPKLPEQLGDGFPRKRHASVLNVNDLEHEPRKKMLSLDNFGGFIGDETSVSSLPQLSGAFVRSFVARYMQSRE